MTGRSPSATGSRSTSPSRCSRPEEAHALVARSGCRTAKVKVADPGGTLAEDQARLEAVRDALGPSGRIRVDANGAWDVDTAVAVPEGARPRPPAGSSTSSSRAPPSRSWRPSAAGPRVPVAADESIRRAADPYRVRDLEAADIAVLKVQPLGGVRACLRIAEDIGLPIVVSSALETSVGMAAGVALAAALPELRARLRAGDRRHARRRRGRPPLVAGRRLRSRCTGPRSSEEHLARVAAVPGPGGALAGPAGRGTRAGAGSPVVTSPSVELARAVVSALVDAGVREVVVAPGSRNAPLVVRGVRRRRGRAGPAAHPDRRAHRPASWPSGLTKVGSPAAVICTSGTAVANLHPAAARGRARRRATRRRHRRPAGPAARHRRQPDHRPGRRLRPARDVRRPRSRRRVRRPHRPRPRRRSAAPQRPARRPAGARRTGGTPRRSRAGQARPSALAPAGPTSTLDPSARARSWWPGTTPARRRGSSRSRPAGRCSPSRRSGSRARATPRSAPTGCCSAGRSADEVERVVVFGHPTLSRPVSRLLQRDGRRGAERRRPGASGPSGRSRSTAHLDPRPGVDARRARLVRPLEAGRRRRPAGPLDALLARRGRADAVRRRRCRRAGAAAGRTARRRGVQPGPRPGPDGAALRGRRAPQGDRQPRPVRHRRHRLDGGRRRAGPRLDAVVRADGRRDVPARRQRAGASTCTTPNPT